MLFYWLMPKKCANGFDPVARRRRPLAETRSKDGLRPHPSPSGAGAPRSRPSSLPVIAASDPHLIGPPELLIGRARVAYSGSAPIPVLLLQVQPEYFDDVSFFDWDAPPAPSRLARACLGLWQAGLRLPDIVSHLGLNVGPSVVNRYVSGARCVPYVLEQLDRGLLDWGHVRVLHRLSAIEQRTWAEKTVASRSQMTVRGLRQAVSGSSVPRLSPDMRRYQDSIQSALQADHLHLVVKAPGRYRLEIHWTLLPSLQRIFELLGSAPNLDNAHSLPDLPRLLVLDLESDNELEALVSHLVEDQ